MTIPRNLSFLAEGAISTGVLGTANGGSGNASLTFPSGTASIGYLNIPQNSQSAAYTTVAGDAGSTIFHPASDSNI